MGEAGEVALKYSPFDLKTLVFIQVPFMAWMEFKRWDSWKRTGEVSVNGYEPWDPLNYRSDRNRLAELKNGRLAMVGFPRLLLAGGVPGRGAHRVPEGTHVGPGA